MENNLTWLIIADASKARIYAMRKALFFNDPRNVKNLQLIGQYQHEESRKKASELVTDKLGEFGTGTFVEATQPKAHESEHFALEIIEHIEAGRKENLFRDLILIAPANFMGLLHKHMPHETKKLIFKTIEKDYTQQNEQTLLESLANFL